MGEVEIWLDPGVNIQKDVEQWFTDGQLLETMWYTENIYILYIYIYYGESEFDNSYVWDCTGNIWLVKWMFIPQK